MQEDSFRARTVRLFLLFSMQQDAAPWQALLDARPPAGPERPDAPPRRRPE